MRISMFKHIWVNCWLIMLLFMSWMSQAAPASVKVGLLYPLSGSAAGTGLAIKEAIEYGAELVNGADAPGLPYGGVPGLPNHENVSVELVFADHQGSVEIGVREAERLIKEEKVIALIGCYHSSITAKVSEVAERENVPFLSATSTSPELTKRGFSWFFRSTPHDELFVENFYQFLDDIESRDNIDLQNIAIFNENTIWGSGIANHEMQVAEQYGRNIVLALQYPAKIKSMDVEVDLLKNVNPDIIFQASYLNDALMSIEEYSRKGFRPKAILGMNAGFTSPGFIEKLGSKAENILSRDVWSEDLRSSKPIVKVIADHFKDQKNGAFNGNSARAFTGFLVMVDALNRAQFLTRENVKNSLIETDIPGDEIIMPWQGVNFDPQTHQNNLGQGIIVQIQGGRYHTVWPFHLASRMVRLQE